MLAIEIVSVRDATDKEKEPQEAGTSQDSRAKKLRFQNHYNTRSEKTRYYSRAKEIIEGIKAYEKEQK